jgi:hypothetical protein
MVCSLRQSSRATSRLLRPSATRANTCSSRGEQSHPRELTIWSEGTWLMARRRIASVRCWPTCPRCTLWIHLQRRRKGTGETKQSSRSGAKCIDDDVLIVSVEQNDFGDPGMSQMQPADYRQVRPTVSGTVGVEDGDLHRQELVVCRITSGSQA